MTAAEHREPTAALRDDLRQKLAEIRAQISPGEPDKIGLTWHEDDGLWIATEDRRGCWASATTRGAALHGLADACRAWDDEAGAS